VPAGVVDLLEIVDVHHQHPEAPAVAPELLQARADGRLGPAAVGDPGQVVEQRQPLHPLQVLGRPARGGVVVEHLDRPGDGAVGVPDGKNAHPHRDAVALPVVEIHVGLARLAVLEGGGKRAVPEAEPGARVVDVDQQVVHAAAADHFGAPVPGQGLRPPVPVGDAALAVGEVDAVGDRFEQVVVQVRGKIGCLGHAALCHRRGGMQDSRGGRPCRLSLSPDPIHHTNGGEPDGLRARPALDFQREE
jgi:hypothetical protein